MNAPIVWSRRLIAVGLAGMLIGAIDPLEGSFIILPGIAVVAFGALIRKSRYRTLLYWSLVLVAFGVSAMVVLSWFGGIGGQSGRPIWWGIFIVPYPVGWFLGLVGAVLMLIETWERCPPRPSSVG